MTSSTDEDFEDKSNASSGSDDEHENFEPSAKKMKFPNNWDSNNYHSSDQQSDAGSCSFRRQSFRSSNEEFEDDEDEDEDDNYRHGFKNHSNNDLSDHNNDLSYEQPKANLGTITPSPSEGVYGKGYQMLKKLGYEGGGLGKRGDGIVEPVSASTQEGRRGLGLKLDGLNMNALKWTPDMEELEMPEKMYWLKNESDDLDQLTLDDLARLLVLGNKKFTIDDETKFCDPEILENVLSSKSVFDKLESTEMRNARTRSNPFETIKGSIFLNRAAVKMANMDALCDFMFTKPVDRNGVSLVKDDDLLYFADICAGPGGFSEYVLYRREWEAKGFGFTLKATNDFQLADFCAGPPETFDPYYGVAGDGNIYNPDNQKSFKNYVMKQTDDCGVHFVMADGGFSVEGKENIQEILSKQLYLCQCLVALSILRIKGHFVVKLFDLFTPFSVGLIYLMYKCFEEISICKPNTSRPANSERYLICKWRKPHIDSIERHLFEINEEMWDNPDSETDIRELIRYDELKKDKAFMEYIIESNNRIGRKQIIGLIKIAAFCKDPELKETRQAVCRKRCLELWNLPDHIRTKYETPPADTLLNDLLHDWSGDKQFLTSPPIELKSETQLHERIRSIYDWYFVPIGRKETEKNFKTFFLCLGRKNIHRLTSNGNWQPVHDLNLEISPKTLLYGEIITELIGESKSQAKINALHIIDAIALGGRDIRRFSLDERIRMCEKFARALNKPYKVTAIEDDNGGMQIPYSPIRCKKLFKLTEFHQFFDCMRKYHLKDGNYRYGLRIRSNDDRTVAERFFVPGGLMFFNKTNINFQCQISKKTGHYYYYNMQTHESFYISNHPNPRMFYGSFRSSFLYRLIWRWVNVLQVEENMNDKDKESDLLYRFDISNYIHKFLLR